MQPTTKRAVPVITCDGTGVVSHAGTVLLAELADRIGLPTALSEATDGLRERRAGHDPGRVLVDVAVAIADGAVTISDVQALADQQGLHGPVGSVASTPTIWRVLDAVGCHRPVPADRLGVGGPLPARGRRRPGARAGRGGPRTGPDERTGDRPARGRTRHAAPASAPSVLTVTLTSERGTLDVPAVSFLTLGERQDAIRVHADHPTVHVAPGRPATLHLSTAFPAGHTTFTSRSLSGRLLVAVGREALGVDDEVGVPPATRSSP